MLVALVVALAGCGTQQSSSSRVDACEVFGVEQVAAIVGNDVDNGVPTGGGTGCVFNSTASNGNTLVVAVDERTAVSKYAETSTSTLQVRQAVVGDRRVTIVIEGSDLGSATIDAAMRDASSRM